MPYERTEVSAQEIERQKEICARVRSALGSGERFAMVDTYGCQQNESDSEVLRTRRCACSATSARSRI